MVFKIAVIGHRDLRLEDKESIKSALKEWRSKTLPQLTNDAPTLVTSLAAGADQMVASVLTEKCPNETGAAASLDLQVIFPFERTEYKEKVEADETEYNGPGVSWSFDELLKRARNSDEVQRNMDVDSAERIEREKQSEENKKLHEIKNEESYRNTGRFFAETADIIIALWDGVDNGERGGTSDTVLYALSPECQQRRAEGFCTRAWKRREFVRSKRQPLKVHWLVIPRVKNPFPVRDAFAWHVLAASATRVEKPAISTRSFWAAGAWLIPIALAVLSIFVSLAGYQASENPAKPTASFISNKLLLSVSHLSLNGFDDRAGKGAFWILLGRWVAVMFFVSGIASVILFNVRTKFVVWRAASRRHDVVCGIGRLGRALVKDACGDRTETIAVEAKPDEADREVCRQSGTPLLEGDATEAATLRKLKVSNITNVFVVCGDDEISMQVVHQFAKMPHIDNLICCVELEAQEHFQLLYNALPETSKPDLRIFNTESITARMLLQVHHIDRFAVAPHALGARVIVVGDSAMAHALVHEILQQGIFEDGKELTLAWLRSDAEASCRDFTKLYPIFDDACRCSKDEWIATPLSVWLKEKVLPIIQFITQPQADLRLLELFEGKLCDDNDAWVTSVFVATDSPSKSASIAYTIGPFLNKLRSDKQDVTLACYYSTSGENYRRDIERAFNVEFPFLPVRVFSDFMGQCTRETVRADLLDIVARRLNGVYNNIPPAADESCSAKWRQTSEDDKESSRRAAAHAWVKQRIRARLARSSVGAKAATEALARIEHRRWCAEYLLKGFRPLTRIPSDHSPFTHKPEETQEIKSWFLDRRKAHFKALMRHVDLVPYNHIKTLLAPLGGGFVKREEGKDLEQVKYLDELLDGAELSAF